MSTNNHKTTRSAFRVALYESMRGSLGVVEVPVGLLDSCRGNLPWGREALVDLIVSYWDCAPDHTWESEPEVYSGLALDELNSQEK